MILFPSLGSLHKTNYQAKKIKAGKGKIKRASVFREGHVTEYGVLNNEDVNVSDYI